MSGTSHLTSGETMTLRERLKPKNNPIKGKVFSVMVVRVMVTSSLRVLLISRNNKKGHYVSWSDEDEESNGESANHVASLTGRFEFDEDPYGDDITYDKLFNSYEKVCLEREKQKKIIAKLEDENEKLLSTVYELQNEVRFLTYQLDNLTKSVRIPYNGPNMLNEICLVEKGFKNFTGKRPNSKSLNEQGESSKNMLVSPKSKIKVTMFDNISLVHYKIKAIFVLYNRPL